MQNKLKTKCSRRSTRGNAIIEFALIAPLLLGFITIFFDSGMYVYTFISVESAARAAALRNSGSVETATDQSTACTIATNQLVGLPSVGSASGTCSGAPLIVSSVMCNPTACGSAGASADGTYSTLVTVKYSVPGVFGIPFAGPPTITASSQMKLRSLE